MTSCFSTVSSPCVPQPPVSSTPPVCSPPASSEVPDVLDAVEDSEVIGDDLDSLLDSFSSEQGPAEVKHGACVDFVADDE